MIGPLKFLHVYCCQVYFISVRFLNNCMPRKTVYLLWQAGLPGLAFCGGALARLLTYWDDWAKCTRAGSVLCGHSISCKWNLPFFHQKGCLFYLSNLLHIINPLFSHFCSFQNAIFHKMLKPGFWAFKVMFLSFAAFINASIFFL